MELNGLQLYRFRDRVDAGRQLAIHLSFLKKSKSLVLALPRGGVVIGYEVAKRLHLKLNVLIVRKIGHPNNPELGIGAITEISKPYLDREMLSITGLQEGDFKESITGEQAELKRRLKKYRMGKSLSDLAGKSIILVDDGIATGVTSLASIYALRQVKVNKIILAVPVCASDTADKLKKLVDEFVCLIITSHLGAIGNFYDNFSQVDDQEVVTLLRKSRKL